jgi:hypothetical protein
LKANVLRWLRIGRRILTEVPGWPDAPVSMQLRRAMPVLIPCAGLVLLLDWHLLAHAPRERALQSALGPLVALEEEVAELRLTCTDEAASTLSEGAAQASRLLLTDPSALPDTLAALKAEAARRGWEASFVAADIGGIVHPDEAVIGYLPVRAKLLPAADNTDIFGSFMELMQRFSESDKRIDLIRLSVRADETRWQLVELNFRLAYPLHQ